MEDLSMDGKFKKGNNKGRGRPRLSQAVKEVRSKCLEEVAKIVEVLSLPIEEAEKIMTDPKSSLLMHMFYEAIKKGDRKAVTDLINRFLPKPVEESNEAPKQIIELAYKID